MFYDSTNMCNITKTNTIKEIVSDSTLLVSDGTIKL